MDFNSKKLYGVTEDMKKKALEKPLFEKETVYDEARKKMSRQVELKVNDDNFVVVGELISALKKLPADMKACIVDDEYSGRALNEDDLYTSFLGDTLYIGGDLDD